MPELIDPIYPPQSQEGMPVPEERVVLSYPQVVEDPPASEAMVDKLNSFLEMKNIADTIDENTLKEMGGRVVSDYEIDKDSRKDWEEIQETALELARQVRTQRAEMANIKYPTLATAAIQFSARAYSNIIKGRDVVKAKIIGLHQEPPPMESPEGPGGPPPQGDPMAQPQAPPPQNLKVEKEKRAARLGAFMSYQMLEEVEDWENALDQLLVTLPITGCCFKKTYYDVADMRVKSPLVTAEALVVNYMEKNLETASRITHVFELTPNEIVERVRGGIFLDIDLGEPSTNDDYDSSDEDAPHTLYEQHRLWDIDGDGYQEPYVITVHADTEQVLRIASRFDADGVVTNEKGEIVKIEPVQYFTRFIFMPAFDGNFYGMGYGTLLGDLNSSINSLINQLLDAGTLSNRQAGFLGKGINLGRGDEALFRPGEWKHVVNTGDDLRKGIVPLPVREPSGVLFNLLGLLLEASKEVSSVSDVLTGEQQGANASPTTTLALIEQSLKVFSSIYKRLHRSLKSEFRKVRRLDRLYLSEDTYKAVLDDPAAVMSDFYEKDMDVEPVSDETELTNVQKMVKAQAITEMMGTGLNDREIQKRFLEAIEIPDIGKILPPENAPPPPDPEIELKKQELSIKEKEVINDAERVKIEQRLNEAKIEKMRADTERSRMNTEKTASDKRKTDSEAITDEHMRKLDSLTKVVQMQSEAMSKLTDKVLEERE